MGTINRVRVIIHAPFARGSFHEFPRSNLAMLMDTLQHDMLHIRIILRFVKANLRTEGSTPRSLPKTAPDRFPFPYREPWQQSETPMSLCATERFSLSLCLSPEGFCNYYQNRRADSLSFLLPVTDRPRSRTKTQPRGQGCRTMRDLYSNIMEVRSR